MLPLSPLFVPAVVALVLGLFSTLHGLPVPQGAPTGGSSRLHAKLTIENANNVKVSDVSMSNPYVEVLVDQKLLGSTRKAFKTVNPVWGDAFEYEGLPSNGVVNFRLRNYNLDNDSLGEASLNLTNTTNEERSVQLPVYLTTLDGAAKSQMATIGVRYSSGLAPTNFSYIRQVGPVSYSKHYNGPLWTTYQVQLHNVPEHFDHKMAEWNKDYPSIQKVFGDGPEAPFYRAAIQAQHIAMYRDDPSTEYGQLDSADAFLRGLLASGERDGKPLMYTYVITETTMNFSETGDPFLKDAFSKHMAHSGAAYAVYYAGEFHVRRGGADGGGGGDLTLVMDDNSGTYSPPKARLPILQKLMADNFPGIRCEVKDRNDPELVATRKKIFEMWGSPDSSK